MDWKKDYRVSDLFRRNEGQEPPARQPAAASETSKPETSLWKKEIKLSSLFRRKRSSAPKEQLALPAPGDTLTEAPAPTPAPPAPTPAPDSQATTGEAPPPAADAPVADPTDGGETDATAEVAPAGEPAAEATPSDAPDLAAAAAAAAAASVTEPAEAAEAAPVSETPPGEADEASTEDPPVQPVEPAEGTKKGLFGRKSSKTPADKGPDRRERQPGPTAGAVSARKPARGGQLPQVPLMKALNLLPQDIKLPKTTLRPKVAQIAVAGVAVLVAGGMAFFWWSENQRLNERQDTVEDLEAQVATLQAESAAPAEQDGTALAGEALSRATALSGAIDPRVGWDRLLRELSLTLPDNVWFSSMVTTTSSPVPQTTPDESGAPVPPIPVAPSTLTINGFAMTEDDVAQLLARLGVIPEFSSVQLEVAAEDADLTENVFSFTVIATLKPLPGGTR